MELTKPVFTKPPFLVDFEKEFPLYFKEQKSYIRMDAWGFVLVSNEIQPGNYHYLFWSKSNCNFSTIIWRAEHDEGKKPTKFDPVKRTWHLQLQFPALLHEYESLKENFQCELPKEIDLFHAYVRENCFHGVDLTKFREKNRDGSVGLDGGPNSGYGDVLFGGDSY